MSHCQNVDSAAAILWSFAKDEYVAHLMRLSWPNLIQIVGVVLDVALMLSALLYVFHLQNTFSISTNPSFAALFDNDAILRTMVDASKAVLLNSGSESEFYSTSISALALGGAFVVLVSLPLVVEQLFHWRSGRDTFTTSPMWIKATWLFKTFFVAVVVALMKLVQCVPMDSRRVRGGFELFKFGRRPLFVHLFNDERGGARFARVFLAEFADSARLQPRSDSLDSARQSRHSLPVGLRARTRSASVALSRRRAALCSERHKIRAV